MGDLTRLTLPDIHRGLRARAFSAEKLARAYLSRIEQNDARLGAYLTVTKDKALEKAAAIDDALAAGDALPPLAGVPCALKDNFSTRGIPTTCASKMLEKYIPPYDAAAWERLDAAGCALLGKTNMDEFAMGSSGEHSAFFPTLNPLDESLVPGGSSSGSAAAVASREAAFALGSDTGGSVRLPAAYCGCVGLRPTWGAISRYGLIAFASSLDTVGIVSRDITDCAMLFDMLRGADARDQTARAGGDSLLNSLNAGARGMTVAILREDAPPLTGKVADAYQRAIAGLEKLGARIVETSLPETEHALNAYFVLTAAEAMSNLMLYDGVRLGAHGAGDTTREMYVSARRGFGEEVKRRLMMGVCALGNGEAADGAYRRAAAARRLITRAMNNCLLNADVILSPVYAGEIKRIGQAVDPVRMYQSDRFLVPAALAGLPALALPCGLQLTARAFEESAAFRAARALEREGLA